MFGSKLIRIAFSKTKVKVNMCGACSFNRDLEFLKYQIWKMDPDIQVEVEKSKQRDGKFEVIMTKQNQQPKVIFNAQESGRITPFNVMPVIKQIRDW